MRVDPMNVSKSKHTLEAIMTGLGYSYGEMGW